MEAKYICGELPAVIGTCYGAMIFPSFMNHKEVAQALNVKVVSAGQCRKDSDGKWYGYGYSQSLGLRHQDSDDAQLNRLGDEH